MAADPRTDDTLGRELLDAGCRQGALVELPTTIVAWQRSGGHEGDWQTSAREALTGTSKYVVASQDCDVAAKPCSEPYVEVLEVEETDDRGRLGNAAKGNSARVFLLERTRDQGLIALAGQRSLIEKQALLGVAFHEILSRADKDRFARWLAGRYDRPALPDDIVELVARPFEKAVRNLRKKKDTLLELLDLVDEIRMRATGEPGTRSFGFLLLLGGEGELSIVQKANLVAWVEEVCEEAGASFEGVALRTSDQVTLAEYLATMRLPLGHYSED